jgi:hypothetical protein
MTNDNDFVLYDPRTKHIARLPDRKEFLVTLGIGLRHDIRLPICGGEQTKLMGYSEICSYLHDKNMIKEDDDIARLVRTISPDHAALLKKEGSFFVLDRASQKGTSVRPADKRAFSLYPETWASLNPGDTLYFGGWEVLFNNYKNIAAAYKISGEQAAKAA